MSLAKKNRKTKTIEALAAEVGIDEKTLRNWVKRGCPRGSLDDVLAWRSAHGPRRGYRALALIRLIGWIRKSLAEIVSELDAGRRYDRKQVANKLFFLNESIGEALAQ